MPPRLGILLVFISLYGCSAARPPCAAPDESGRYLSAPQEVSACLQSLARRRAPGVKAELQELGRSVEGRPVEALIISAADGKPGRLKVMLVAAQHGMEPSGAEALLRAAGELMQGDLRPWLESLEVIIIPLANPDGYARNRRANAAGVNTSTDFGRLAAPESRAVNSALLRFQPEAVLDLHESALLKKKTLGAEGYLADFETQFEYANNPNVAPGLRTLSARVLLPELIAEVERSGLQAARYLGEITNLRQVLTHGGLSAGNLRNKAALLGAVSFLVENRLDPSTGSYPTRRNIAERVRKQLISVQAFLKVSRERRAAIAAAAREARLQSRCEGRRWLNPRYAPEAPDARRSVELRSIKSGRLEAHTFSYHARVSFGVSSALPRRCEISSDLGFFREWLTWQGLAAEEIAPNGMAPRLSVDLCAPLGFLAPIYLDAASSSSILPRLGFAPRLHFLPQQP